MSKILKLLAVSTAGLAFALSVFAQSPSPTPQIQRDRQGVRHNIQQGRQQLKEDVMMKKDAMKSEMKEMRQMTGEEIEKIRMEFRDRVKMQQEELKSRIETKRAELKERLKKIKDERKKQTVERIDMRLDDLNERMTHHFILALVKLEKVLERIDARTDKAEEKGINVSSVRTAIEVAHKAIIDARTAVEAQAGKTYKIEVNTEAKLKADVGKARQVLHADLKAVREKVKAVRDTVHEAARSFAKVHGRDLPSPSLSPSPSPTP